MNKNTKVTKKKKEKEKVNYLVKFKKEPVWFRGLFVGKFNKINFNFQYKEYYSEEADEVVKVFKFKWPGRVPDDIDFAEKGIKKLFLKRREDDSLEYKVINDDALEIAEREEQESFQEMIEEITDEDIIQEGLKGENSEA